MSAAHLVASGGARFSLCGVKDPVPVVAVAYVDRHVAGYGLVVCEVCAAKRGTI